MFDYCILTHYEKKFVEKHVASVKGLKSLSDKNKYIVYKDDDIEMENYIKDLPFKGMPIKKYEQSHADAINKVGSSYGFDVANAYDYAVKNCGNENWIVIAHADLTYQHDILSDLHQFMKSEVGAIGDCRMLLAINRKAYEQCHFGFWTVMGLAAFKDTTTHEYHLRMSGDPRLRFIKPKESIAIRGLDVGDLLLTELLQYGWLIIPIPDNLVRKVRHHGAGSGYWVQDHEGLPDYELQKQRYQQILGTFSGSEKKVGVVYKNLNASVERVANIRNAYNHLPKEKVIPLKFYEDNEITPSMIEQNIKENKMFTMTKEWLQKYYGSQKNQIEEAKNWIKQYVQGGLHGISFEESANYKHLIEYQPNTNDIVRQCLLKVGSGFDTELQAHKFVNLLRVPLAQAYEDVLLSLPKAPQTILELGVGGDSAISTAVFLAWVEKNKGHLTSVEHNPLDMTWKRYGGYSNLWTFIQSDSKKALQRLVNEEQKFDLIFIDTCHIYSHTAAELELAKKMTDVIIMDDATFAGNGDDLVPGGVERAIKEFKVTNKDWAYKDFWGGAVGLLTKKQTIKKRTTTTKGEK